MILEEDIQAMKKNLRGCDKDNLVTGISPDSNSKAGRVWAFGKQLGLHGNNAVMTESLKKLDDEVSNVNLCGREIIDGDS